MLRKAAALRAMVLGVSGGWVLLATAPARANEGPTPYLPAATTGTPVGALPPPGFYGSMNLYTPYGKVDDGKGRKLPIEVANHSASVTLIWSSPYHILGAQYGAGIVQIASVHTVNAKGVGGRKTSTTGAFNTVLQPIILSWKVGRDVFVSTAQSFYLKDGQYSDTNGVRDQTAYANNYYTYEPSVAVSYLHKGWDLTANLVYDTNTINHRTHYQSGDTLYVDLTAARTIGKNTFGLIGNITQQVQDDKQLGIKVGNGQRVSHIMAGPIISHNFGKITMALRYLQDLRSRNDVALSIGFLTISTKF